MARQMNGRRRRDGHDADPGLPSAPGTSGSGTQPGALRVSLASSIGESRAARVVVPGAGSNGEISIDGTRERATLIALDPPRARLETAGSTHQVLLLPVPDARRAAAGVRRVEVVVDGWRLEVDVESEARARLRERATIAGADAAHGGPLELRAIIPGRVLSVDVAEGDTIETGGRLLVIEAMKMQNELRAPRGGTVGRVAVGAGQTVELGDLLLVLG